MMQRIISSLIWLAYALTWLAVLFAAAGLVLMGVEDNSYNRILLSDIGVLLIFITLMIFWGLILWRRVSLKWPLWMIIILLPLGFFVVSIISIIGFVKFLIEAAGRRNVLAGSCLRSTGTLVPPRGLVESERGYSLISVMVSVVILTIAFTMAVSTFSGASRLAKNAGNLTTAGNFAEGVMERVVSQRYDSITSVEVSDSLPKLPQARCVVQVTPKEEGLKQVTVICSWMEGERQRSTRLSTLVAKGEMK